MPQEERKPTFLTAIINKATPPPSLTEVCTAMEKAACSIDMTQTKKIAVFAGDEDSPKTPSSTHTLEEKFKSHLNSLALTLIVGESTGMDIKTALALTKIDLKQTAQAWRHSKTNLGNDERLALARSIDNMPDKIEAAMRAELKWQAITPVTTTHAR